MKALQGTWPGALLDSERMQLLGWIDMSYTASSDRSTNLPMGFNHRANEFLVQQNWVRFERTVVTGGTTEPTFGFRSDWILPGADYRFTVARGLFSGQLTASDCTFDWASLTLNSTSTDSLHSLVFKTQLSVDSGASIDITRTSGSSRTARSTW